MNRPLMTPVPKLSKRLSTVTTNDNAAARKAVPKRYSVAGPVIGRKSRVSTVSALCPTDQSTTPYGRNRNDPPSSQLSSSIPPSITPCSTSVRISDADLKAAVSIIKAYLEDTSFPINFAPEELLRLNPAIAKEIANFLMRRIDPSINLSVFEEEFPAFLRTVHYPASITKTHCRVGSTQSVSMILSAFVWLIHLLSFLEASQNVVDPPPSEYLELIFEQYCPSEGYASQRRSVLTCPMNQMDDRMTHAIVNFVNQHKLEGVDQSNWASSGVDAASLDFFITEADLDEVLTLLYRCRKRYLQTNGPSFEATPAEQELLSKFLAFYRHLLAVIKVQSDKQHEYFIEERDKLTHKNLKIRSQTNDLEAAKKSLCALSSDSASLSASLSVSERMLLEGTTNIDSLKNKLNELNVISKQLDQQCMEYRAKATDLENRSNELQRFQNGIKDLEEEISALESNRKSMEEKSNALTAEMTEASRANTKKWNRVLERISELENGSSNRSSTMNGILMAIGQLIIDYGSSKPRHRNGKKISASDMARLGTLYDLEVLRSKMSKGVNNKSEKCAEFPLEQLKIFLKQLNATYINELIPHCNEELERLDEVKTTKMKSHQNELFTRDEDCKGLALTKKRLEDELIELEKQLEERRITVQRTEDSLCVDLKKRQREYDDRKQNAEMRKQKSQINIETRDRELREKAAILATLQNGLLDEMTNWERCSKPQLWKDYRSKALDFFFNLPERLKEPLLRSKQWRIAAQLPVSEGESDINDGMDIEDDGFEDQSYYAGENINETGSLEYPGDQYGALSYRDSEYRADIVTSEASAQDDSEAENRPCEKQKGFDTFMVESMNKVQNMADISPLLKSGRDGCKTRLCNKA